MGLTKKGRKKRKKRILSKDDTKRVFDSLITLISEVLRRIAAQEQMIRTNYQKAGRQVSMDQMYDFCQKMLDQEMTSSEPLVYIKHNTTEAAVAAGVKKYGEDPEIKERVARFTQLANSVKKADTTIPDDLTEEKFTALLSEMMESITQAMEKTVESVKEAGADSKSPEFQQALTTQFQPAVQTISAATMKKYGVSEDVFTAAMTKFQSSPVFNATLTRLTNEQQERFSAIGVSHE